MLGFVYCPGTTCFGRCLTNRRRAADFNTNMWRICRSQFVCIKKTIGNIYYVLINNTDDGVVELDDNSSCGFKYR